MKPVVGDSVNVVTLKGQEESLNSDGWFLGPMGLTLNNVPDKYKLWGHGKVTSIATAEYKEEWANTHVREGDYVIQHCIRCQYNEEVWNELVQYSTQKEE